MRFDAFLGYDGVLPQADWFPVVCEVHNDGPTFKATIEVDSSQFQSGQRRFTVVELPTGTTKRFSIPVFAAGRSFNTWEARLRDERGQVRAEAGNLRLRRTIAPRVPLFAAVTRTAPTLPDFAGTQAEFSPVVARLQPAVFPDTPLGLQSLSAIYLSSEKALELKDNQTQALLSWLRAGGRLIVSVEQLTHITGNDWLRALLPCAITGLGSATTPSALQEWLTASLPSNRLTPPVVSATHSVQLPSNQAGPRRMVTVDNPYAKLPSDPTFESKSMQMASATLRDGQVLIGSSAQPLAVSARRGRGEVVALLFSPELEPFLSWTNRAWFWARMAGFPPELFLRQRDGSAQGYAGGFSLDSVFGAMIDSRQVRKLPIGWLLVLLLSYLVVIGPFDQWWLKKINRQMWTWITFPAYVALFSVLIYFIGYKLRAGETEYNELHIVDVMPTGPQAESRGTSYASIYSPANATYPLASDLPSSSLRGEFVGAYAGEERSRSQIEQQPAGFRADVSVPVWTSQLFVGDWWQRGESPLRLRVTGSDGRYQVEAENRTDTLLIPARLVIGDTVFDLGRLPARQVTKVIIKDFEGQALSRFLRDHATSFQTASGQRRRLLGDSEASFIADVAGGAMAASFPSLLTSGGGYPQYVAPSSLDLVRQLERGDAILLAWATDYTPIKPMNRFSARRSDRDTLFRVAVPVEMDTP